MTVRKTTGAGTTEHQVDASFIELAVIFRTRKEAWQLLNYLAAWLPSLEGRTDIMPVRLVHIEEIKSPVMPKWIDPEHRRVQADFRIHIRRPR
ncbi:phage tail termination protein [Corynebacterium sp. SCR221107]|uniref:phage tail termination protein n=1 Tax=Corynebacterium sp. SCR221107 TaxID=3017361 RepID=UPI003FA46FA8